MLSKCIKKQWQLIIVIFSIIAIFSSFFLIFFFHAYADIPLYVIILLGGVPLFLQILLELVKGNLGADLLAALALSTAVVLQQYLTASFIILMLASGKSLELIAQKKASSVLQALFARMPKIAHRKKNIQIEDIPLKDINVDDKIIIFPHETCPVDGIVIDGHSSMDESYLTGEPYQISKTVGSTVISGSLNGNSALTIIATKLPIDSRYASIVKILERATQTKPAIRRLGDQIGALFAPFALIFALITWYAADDVVRFLAVLVIATPCPLIIAIPITLISAISRAAKQSIIIKNPTVLEQLPRCKTAIFDKTGTLTYGKPALTNIHTNPKFTKDFVLQMTASLERYSKHPLASAIMQIAKEHKVYYLEPSKISEQPGQGLKGVIDQHEILVTNRKTFLSLFPQQKDQLPENPSNLECVIICDKQYMATFSFHDEPRLESKAFISHLGPLHQFNKIILLSGDRAEEVNYLAKKLNFDEHYANQSPEQKLVIVNQEREKNPTVFMGDGINDAPALTAATVGIAFGTYSDVTAAAAGAVIMENTLFKVDEIIHLSLETYKIALQSAIGGMIFSLVGMFFAAFGYINPITGAILQEIIDVLAILNALRLAFGGQIKIDLPQT